MNKLVFAAILLASTSGANAANIIVNGDFETGNLSGWSNATNRYYADSNNGGTTPASGRPSPINANGGNFFAVGDQNNSGATVLSQSFTVSGATVSISFDWFNNTYFGHTGTNLTGTQSQRVDIMTANASATDTGAGVVANLMLNQTANAWQTALYSLSLAAGSYKLRFASYECCSHQNFGVDNVSVSEEVPEPAMIALFGLGAAALGLARRRRKAG